MRPRARSSAPSTAPSGRATMSSTGAAASLKPVRNVSNRSEEHTSELQSPCNLVCRLLLEKKKHALAGGYRRRRLNQCSVVHRPSVRLHRRRICRTIYDDRAPHPRVEILASMKPLDLSSS